MFTGARGSKLLGTDYTAKHERLALVLSHEGGEEFKAAFTGVAAYFIASCHFGCIVNNVRPTEVATLAATHWERFMAADQAGTWPRSAPGTPEEAAEHAKAASLRGYIIEFSGCEAGWAVSKDFVLLGRRSALT